MEKSCLKIPLSFLQFTKKAEKSNFMEQNTFFRKFVIFAYKLLSFRILHFAYPKLVGTPCRRLHVNKSNDYYGEEHAEEQSMLFSFTNGKSTFSLFTHNFFFCCFHINTLAQ